MLTRVLRLYSKHKLPEAVLVILERAGVEKGPPHQIADGH